MLDDLSRLPHKTVIVLIAVCVIVFVHGEMRAPDLNSRYGCVPADLIAAWKSLTQDGWNASSAGVLLKTISACFMHSGLPHILNNMVMLWAFGCLVSEHLGKWWALGLFFVTGICGNIAQTCLNPESAIPIIGASGAVSGFEGIYLGLALRWPLRWPDVWPIAHPIPPMNLGIFAIIGASFDIYSLMRNFQGVAYGAHLGGFISGLIISAIITQCFATDKAFAQSRWKH